MAFPVVHWEVVGSNGPALEKFYAELFGWHVQSMPEMNYGLVDTHAGGGINGGIGTSQDGRSGVMVYVEADDLQSVLDKAEKLGGKTVMPIMEIPGAVTMAQFSDPQGNTVGLVKSEPGTDQPATSDSRDVSSGVRLPVEGSSPGVQWFEILGTDGPALRTFYSSLFGWEIKTNDAADYGEVSTGTPRGISGGIGKSQGEPIVTVYAEVDDLKKYLERAESLGGKTVLEPMSVGEDLTIAAFRDPQENLFGLFRSTHEH